MAGGDDEKDQESQTEDATSKKLDDLREKGVLPKSAEVSAILAVIGAGTVLATRFDTTVGAVQRFAVSCFSLNGHGSPMEPIGMASQTFAATLVPVAAAGAVVAVASTVAQTRGYFSMGQITRNFENLDPIAGLGKAMPNKEVLADIGKMILKVGLVGFLVWGVVEDAMPRLTLLSRLPTPALAQEVMDVAHRVLVRGVIGLSALAVLDYVLSRRKFDREARMSKKEISDEHKEQEGDPKIKGKRRQRAAQIARKRTIAEVKNATVLVVNPTHIAVALRYVNGKDAAPMVLAKGVDELALKMREEARRCGVPIVENRPLARAMNANAKVGRPVPVELYESVARVIAHVLRIRGGRPAPRPQPPAAPGAPS